MSETIIIIENFYDKTKILNLTKQYPNSRIFSINYKTHKFLEKSNISHSIGDRILTNSDKQSIDMDGIKLCKNWFANEKIKNSLIFKNYNLGTFLDLELFQYFLGILKSTKILLSIIKQEKPKNIIGLTQYNDFITRYSESIGIHSITIDSSDVNQLHYDTINMKFNLGIFPISVNISRANYKKFKNFFETIIHKFFNLKVNPDSYNTKSILLLDFNPIIYESLFKELSNIKKNIILLNQRRPAIWNMESLKIIRNSKCKIINLDEFEKFLTNEQIKDLKNFINNIQKIWQFDSEFEKIFSNEGITFWHSIKSSFVNTCNERFNESIKRILLLEKLFEKFSIENVLEWAETAQEEKEVLAVAKNFKINSIMLQHAMYSTAEIWKKFGGFLARFTHPLISQQQAVWGDSTKNFAMSNGHQDKNLLEVGSPRYDNFFNFQQKSSKTGLILLATTGASGIFTEGSTTDAFVKFDNFVREVCKVIKKFPDKKLIVKPHPQSDFINNITSLIKDIDPKIKIIYNANLPKLISVCDAVISFNTSTILLESIIMNKPAIDLQTETWPKENEIVKMNAVHAINDISKIESELTKVLYDDNIQSELLKNSKLFLKHFLYNHGFASKTMAKILNDN